MHALRGSERLSIQPCAKMHGPTTKTGHSTSCTSPLTDDGLKSAADGPQRPGMQKSVRPSLLYSYSALTPSRWRLLERRRPTALDSVPDGPTTEQELPLPNLQWLDDLPWTEVVSAQLLHDDSAMSQEAQVGHLECIVVS